jgi:hypothetical protein
MAPVQKGKVVDESRKFENRWTEEYFFIFIKVAAVCLICNLIICILKEYSIKRRFETKYASQLSGMQCQLRRDNPTQLPNRLAQQKMLLKSSAVQSNIGVPASYLVSENFAKNDETF